MIIKCVSCNWEYEVEEDEWDFAECPNCDFPYKYAEWIDRLYNRIAELERENTMLATKLSEVISAS